MDDKNHYVNNTNIIVIETLVEGMEQSRKVWDGRLLVFIGTKLEKSRCDLF